MNSLLTNYRLESIVITSGKKVEKFGFFWKLE
jgi:hypothetical protein